MLAQGALYRLAATKAPARDLPQLARFLQQTLLTRNASDLPAVRALSRACRSAVEARRSYATTTSATKPTATVKKAVKKEAASKAPKKKTAAKPARKRVAAKTTTKAKSKAKPKTKAKPKKKVAAKKPARPKKPAKVLTPEEKQKVKIAALRKAALRQPVSAHPISSWVAYVSEQTQGKSQDQAGVGAATKELGGKWKNFTPAEHEHYNHLAREKTEARKAEYNAWILSHTPEQIKQANLARAYLRRLYKASGRRAMPSNVAKLVDDRQVTPALNQFSSFVRARHATGDFKGIKGAEAMKLVASEWKALSASEKKKYEDEAAAGKAKQKREEAASS